MTMETAFPGGMEVRGVPSVEEGHDVERISVVRSDEDTMLAMVKLAKILDQVEQKAPRSVSTAWCHGWRLPAISCGEQCSLVLSGPVEKAGYMVRSMRLIPTNKVGQACERVRLPRLPREAGFDQERGQSKVEKDTVTINEEQGAVLPWRKDKTLNVTWVTFGVRSVRHGAPEDVFPRQVWTAMLFFLPRPADRGGLAGYMVRSLRLG